MAKQKPKKKGIVRIIRIVAIVLFLAFLGLIGWIYLTPMLTADSVTLYESYTVEQGNIETTLSFSATLAVEKTETHTATEMSRVKELYVQSGDAVSEGDPLVLLSNGELFTAGFDGAVNEIRVTVGDWVRPNFSIVQVCDLVNLEVTMSVDEYDVKNLTVGQSCTVRVISLGLDFETTIAHIDRVSSSSGTLAYYTVSCNLAVPEEVLPGMRTTVIIPDQSVEDVAMLPLGALSFDEEQQPYVLLKNADDTYDIQYVETGLSDGTNVEIISGVSVGDTVYAVSGTESITAAFSLEDIYISLFGEKVVINAAAGQRMGNADGANFAFSEDGTMPEGFTMPNAAADTDTTAATESTDSDETAVPDDTTQTGDFTPPDGAELPEGFTMPEDGTMPDGATRPDMGSMPDGATMPDRGNYAGRG